MQDLKRRFWKQQVQLVLLVLVGAVGASVLGTWLTTTPLAPPDRTRALVFAVIGPLVMASLLLTYSVRINMRYLRLHLQVRRDANSDELTDLPNRRHFTREGNRRLSRATASRAQVALLLVDIDWFKRVNDRHGHEAGDEVLRHVAQTLLHAAPDDALVARLGGEEFTILHDVSGLDDLNRLAESLRCAVEAACFLYRGEAIRITISLGLALAGPDDTLSRLLSRADKALYAAKHQGRNQFALAA